MYTKGTVPSVYIFSVFYLFVSDFCRIFATVLDSVTVVYKGKKAIVVTRRIATNPLFLIQFQRKFVK
jgi:hypothetical protein